MEEKTRNADLLQKKADEENETREYINKLELKQRNAEEYKAQATSQIQVGHVEQTRNSSSFT